jgi:hypothetical protein
MAGAEGLPASSKREIKFLEVIVRLCWVLRLIVYEASEVIEWPVPFVMHGGWRVCAPEYS